MPISLTDFWEIGSGTFPPLTEEAIHLAEAELGVQLPPELLALLRIQNGGYTRNLVFPTNQATSWAETHVPMHELFGIVVAKTVIPTSNIMQSTYLTREAGVPEKQVVLSGDGHWFITLDYRRGNQPRVAWIDTELDQDIQLADSFAAFLAGIVPGESFDNDYPTTTMWTETDNALTRTFRFQDFKMAFSFMSDVAEESEYQEHHPWWSNEYNVVSFRLRTHDAGNRVTDKDHQLAASIDKLAADYGGEEVTGR